MKPKFQILVFDLKKFKIKKVLSQFVTSTTSETDVIFISFSPLAINNVISQIVVNIVKLWIHCDNSASE